MIMRLPFWTTLAAVWAFVLLGGTPPADAARLCGTDAPAHHHAPDCTACCPCTISGMAAALIGGAPGLPAPRGGVLPPARPPGAQPGIGRASIPVRARGPPGVA